MRLTCPKCQKTISIPDKNLPQDKEKAMIKCPACQQAIVFNVPKQAGQTKPPVEEEKTDVDSILSSTTRTKSCHAKLIEEATGKIYHLKAGKNIIGRKTDISITNGDKYISRKHCLIEIIERPNGYDIVLTDDGSIAENSQPSTNGTFHNGIRLTKFDKIHLDNNDKVKIGRTDFIFKTE